MFFRFRDIHVFVSKVVTSQVVPLKQHNTQSRISLEILKQCSSNLAPAMYITKKHDDTHHAVAMTTLMRLFLFYIRLIFPDFFFNKDDPLPPVQSGELRQYGNHACSEQDSLSHFRRFQMGIFSFSPKETGAKSVAIATTRQVSFFFFCDVHCQCHV